MPVKLTNLATSSLAGAINSSVTSLAISSGDVDKFPTLSAGEWFPLVVVDNAGNREIMRVTARSGATLTVVRGQEGTAALSFANGSLCELRTTAAALAELRFASGARAVKQDAGTDDESLSTTSFVQEAIDALKGGVAVDYDTLDKIADALTALSAATTDALTDLETEIGEAIDDGLAGRIPRLATGDALPTSNQGPIWHDTYQSLMTWQVFNANGASYTGYASVEIGRPSLDGQSSARPGYLKRNGASLSKTTYAALWNWALHTGRVVTLGSWSASPYVFADNGDGTFKLPDNRGEFERIWDDSRGVDSGRAIGSFQADAFQGHRHSTSTYWVQVGGGGGVEGGGFSPTSGVGDPTSDGSNGTPRTASQTRPRSVALLGDIKF